MHRPLKNSNITCHECQVGNYFLELRTYYAWIGDTLVTVPDFPCWVCDSCNHFQFDQKAIGQLKIILKDDVGGSMENLKKSTQPHAQNRRSRQPGQTK